MTQSAEPSGREAKMRRTRIAITEHARKLTAAHGLSGFTIEQVCEPAGISRRTFFNYFPSKEAAVIGATPDVLESAAIREFMATGRADGQISATLIEDLTEVLIATLEEVLDISGTLTHIHEIVGREPQFMDKFFSDATELNSQFAKLIAQREGLAEDDPRPGLAIQLVGGLIHSTALSHFERHDTSSIGPSLRNAVALTRELFGAPPTPAP